ncbi:MAG: AI-2E family transporter [Haloarculaceae archaeon]
MPTTQRQRVLGALILAVSTVSLVVLRQVLVTVFFAITVAYVLYPVRREFARRGLPDRLAAAGATLVGFAVAVLLVTPLFYALYARRRQMIDFIRDLPSEQSVTAFGMTYVVDVGQALTRARDVLAEVAVDVASAAPVIGLKAFLFVLLLYGLLLRPRSVHDASLRMVPGEYHDVLVALHERMRDTLYALYVLQGATAFGTFVIAYIVFRGLGYGAAFSLAVFSGVLQFIPVLGPSIVVAVLALTELVAGDVSAAILVTVLGLVFVGFLPDAVIRPRLASLTTGMPVSLYFVGFVGGTLTVGVVGVIAGPLVVALLSELIGLATAERMSRQTTFDEAPPGPGADEAVKSPDDRNGDDETSADASPASTDPDGEGVS